MSLNTDDLEASLNDAANASTALALALRGILPIEFENRAAAVQWLADEARVAAERSRTAYYEASETKVKPPSEARAESIEHSDLPAAPGWCWFVTSNVMPPASKGTHSDSDDGW
jgi:hypothetical protein